MSDAEIRDGEIGGQDGQGAVESARSRGEGAPPTSSMQSDASCDDGEQGAVGRRDAGGPNPKSEIRNPKLETQGFDESARSRGEGAPPTTPLRLRDPELLAGLGLTNENLRSAQRFMFSAGIQRFWATQRALKIPFVDQQVEEISEVERIRREVEDPRDPREILAQEKLEAKMAKAKPVPPWQSLTGLFPEIERELSPDDREARIRELLNIVVAMLRHEMDEAKAKPGIYRGQNWDPLRKICFHLGIAYSKFSSYSKEATGLAGYEIVDRIRVEGLKEAMREKMRAFIASLAPEIFDELGKNDKIRGRRIPRLKDRQWKLAYLVWRELRDSRIAPEWHRGEWASSYGFCNHARFYRACLLYYGKAPLQLEFEVISECVAAEFITQNAKRKMDEGAPGATDELLFSSSVLADTQQHGPTKQQLVRGTQPAGETPAVPGTTQQVQFFTDSAVIDELRKASGGLVAESA